MDTMHANELDSPAPITAGPLTWRATARPTPGPGQVLIKVAACGVCRSNLHMIEGDWVSGGIPAISPIIPGHEVTGHVVAVGDDVETFGVGDRVGVQPLWWTCESCEYCQGEREQLCHERVITGEHVNGGYGEYMLAHAVHTYLIPDGLDLAEAAPLFCPGITAFGAVDKLDIGPGDTVAVFGLGGVGHMAVQFAALIGAEVIAVGRDETRRQVALDLGASRAVDANDPDQVEAIRDTLDAAVTFAPADEPSRQAVAGLKRGGTLVSGVPVVLGRFPFDSEKVIHASLLGNRQQMTQVLELAAAGKVRTVIERFPMKDAAKALRLLADGKLRSRAVLVND